MKYNKYETIAVEYGSESFCDSLTKEDGSLWTAEDSGIFILTDENGDTVSTGVTEKSVDNTEMKFTVPWGDTDGIDGQHLLLVYVTNTTDIDFREVIGEYRITYKTSNAI